MPVDYNKVELADMLGRFIWRTAFLAQRKMVSATYAVGTRTLKSRDLVLYWDVASCTWTRIYEE